jgi:hypothetical protein
MTHSIDFVVMQLELAYFNHGGILPYMIRNLALLAGIN